MEDFTLEQRDAIRRGIIAGRQAMGQFSTNALVFAGDFIKADGIQVPGLIIDTETTRRIGACRPTLACRWIRPQVSI